MDHEEAHDTEVHDVDGVAVIGMAGRFPGAADLDRFWRNVRDGVESVAFFDELELAAAGVPEHEHRRADYVAAGARLMDMDRFDADFFGCSPREATIMDPQHRVFLELAWEALEDAGYDPTAVRSAGVFGGVGTSAYLTNVIANLTGGSAIGDANVGLGTEAAFLASRVSHKLDLHGPCMAVHTACSSSLVAVHAACQSLLAFECDVAVAGGVAFKVRPDTGYRYQEGGILSRDGHCKPFDAAADGTVFNNGGGVVVLKRLADALADNDTVHAVIRGSAVNNDGAVKASFTAPGVDGQASVVLDALAVAGLTAEDIDYVEAHGSGTRIGDAIEVDALTRAFRRSTDRRGFCGIGSVKSNIGHLDAASGIAGLIKTVLALRHGELPPTLHFRAPSPVLDLETTPFRVQHELTPWPAAGRPRRAGVSAFGFGGTNAHVVVEEPPAPAVTTAARPSQLLVLSARSPEALDAASDRLAAHLREHDHDLVDVAHTLARGRKAFPFRRAVVARDAEEAAVALRQRGAAPAGRAVSAPARVAFLLPGQGSQHVGMAAGLAEVEPVFRTALDRCAEVLLPELGVDLRHVLADGDALASTEFAQPVLFAVEHALAELWRSWGVMSDGLLGHSLGEYVAACLSGVFALEDALRLVALRGRLMARRPGGAMLGVSTDRATAEGLLADGLVLAADNGPLDCVVAGDRGAVARFRDAAAAVGIATRAVSDSYAFHTPLMAPVVAEFADAVAAVPRHRPRIPFVSNVTGTWITAEEAVDPAYWGRHVVSTVQFARGLEALVGDGAPVLLEVGPGRTLSALARRAGAGARAVLSSLPHREEATPAPAAVQRALGDLWTAGVQPDWSAYHAVDRARRVPLPTYPFERRRFWLDVPDAAAPEPAGPPPHPLLDELLVRTVDEVVYRTGFTLDRHWVLTEHKMLDRAIVPGTTYLEMARAAGAAQLRAPVTEVLDVEFLTPLAVREGEVRTVHTIARRLHGDEVRFEVVGHDPDAPPEREWTVHARGRLTGRVLPAPDAPDLADLRARCVLGRADVGRAQAEHHVMTFGDRWRGSLAAVAVGERIAIGELHLPAAHHDEVGSHVLHPALLDLATGFHQWAVLDRDAERRQADREADFYLPLAYDRLVVHRPVPARCTSVVRPHPGFTQSAELRKVDALLVAPDGGVVLEVTGFTAKRVTNPRGTVRDLDAATAAAVHHAFRWVDAPTARERVPLPAELLVVLEDEGVAAPVVAELRARGAAVTAVPADTDWTTATAPLPHDVLFVGAAGDGDHPDRGARHLFRLAKALAVQASAAHRLVVVAPVAHEVDGSEPDLAPGNAALLGVARVIGQENVAVTCRCVDIRHDTPAADVVDEITSTGSGLVALRGGRRLVAELAEADLRAGEPTTVVTGGGVHLVTGGLGGLGLRVARHIADTDPTARIALVGRTALPPRDRWEELLRTSTDRQAERVRAVLEIEATGARVRCYQADVAVRADVAAVLADVRAHWGPVTSVVHAAGTAGDGFILRKDEETFRATLAPKVAGALLLDELTADAPPELFVLFSSTTAVFGAAGQSDYTAANAYLDAFAARRSRRGSRTVSVNWTDWLDTGMAADHGVQRDQGFFRSIGVDDALRSYDAVVRSPLRHVVVGEVNYELLARADPAVLAQRMAVAPLVLSEPIRKALAARVRERPAAGGAGSGGPVDLSGRADGQYSDTERALAAIWARQLGLDRVDVFASLFELGGDSLVALRMVNDIGQVMGVRAGMADLFAHPTVADLAAHLSGDSAPVRAATTSEPSAADDSGDWFELSEAQQGLWLLQQLDESRPELNLPVRQEVRRAVDVAAFRAAVHHLVARHDSLRTVFRDTGGGPRQRVLAEHVPDVPLVDLTDHADPAGELDRLVTTADGEPFDLSRPLVRASLYRLAEEHFAVHLCVHHLVADGISIGILLRELAAAYEAFARGDRSDLAPLPTTYEGYVRGERAWLGGPDSEEMARYWLAELAAPLPRLGIGDQDAPPDDTDVRFREFGIDAETAAALTARARSLDVTAHVLLFSAYAVALRDLSGDDDIVFCVPFSGRYEKALEEVVGMFVNPLAVRVRFDGLHGFRDLVAAVRAKSAAAYAHSRFPFGPLVHRLNPARTPGRNPVFSTAFQFADFLPPAYQTSQLDLCLYGRPRDDRFDLRISYDSRRLSAEEARDVEATFLAAVALLLAEDDPALTAFAEPLARARLAWRRERRPARRGRLQAAISGRAAAGG